MSNTADISKKIFLVAYRAMVGLFGSFLDYKYLDPNVPISKIVSHANFMQYLTDIGNHNGMKILEIGSPRSDR